jgi:hypothetical protein
MAEYTLKIKKIKTPTDANWVTTIPTEYTNIKGRVYNIVKVENGGKSKYDKNGYWQANADLMGLINPFTNPISNKPVTETKIELVYKDIYGWEEGTSEKMYFDFLADQCAKKMQTRYKELYGVDIDISYIKSVEEKKVDDIPPTELSLKYISHVGGEEVKKVTFEVYESVNGNLTLLAEIKDFTAFEIDKTTKKISAPLLDIDERYYASNKLETWLEKNRDKLPKDTKYVLGGYPVEEKKDIKTETKTADNKVVDNNAVSLEGEFTFDVQEENLFKGVNNEFKELEIIGVGEIKETPIDETVDETIDEEIDEEYLEEETTAELELYKELEAIHQEMIIAAETAVPNTTRVDDTLINYDQASFVGAAWKSFKIDDVIKALEADPVGVKYKATTFKESLKKVLFYIKNDSTINDVRKAAYILATGFIEAGYSLCRWESDYVCGPAGEMYPASGPCKAATDYYRQTEIKSKKGKVTKKKNYYTLGLDSKGWPYFGRGLIQLTGKDVYEKYGKLIGVDLVSNGDLALEPQNAYKIISVYMETRTFKHVLKGNLSDARGSVNAAKLHLTEVNNAYNAWLKAFKDIGAIS